MSRRMAFFHLPPIRWLTSFYNPPLIVISLIDYKLAMGDFLNLGKRLIQSGVVIYDNQL